MCSVVAQHMHMVVHMCSGLLCFKLQAVSVGGCGGMGVACQCAVH